MIIIFSNVRVRRLATFFLFCNQSTKSGNISYYTQQKSYTAQKVKFSWKIYSVNLAKSEIFLSEEILNWKLQFLYNDLACKSLLANIAFFKIYAFNKIKTSFIKTRTYLGLKNEKISKAKSKVIFPSLYKNLSFSLMWSNVITFFSKCDQIRRHLLKKSLF